MINLQDNSFENDASIKFILNNLSTIIQQAYVLEEKISQKIFTDIEAMILNSENSIVLELDWQTTIWEISAKFEFRELWFTPQSWIHPKADEKHSNILHSYAFFKLTHYDRGYNYNPNEEFQINNNRFPTSNFFRHDQGYMTIQFFLNYNLIRGLSYQFEDLTKEASDLRVYREMCDWNEFRKITLKQYKKLEDKGFELEGHGTFFEMKIDLLDSELFIKEYEQGKLDKTLEPIEKVLKKVNESFDIFDDIQNKAKKYYLDLINIHI